MVGWEQRIVTGDPQADQRTVEQHRQAAAAQGLSFDVQPLPAGGFHVRAYVPQGGYAQQQQYGPPMGGYAQQQQYGPPMGGYAQPQGAPAYAGAAPAFGGVVVGGAQAAPSLTSERVRYLRKVYGLLLASVVVAGLSGLAAISLGPTMRIPGTRIAAPMLTALMLSNRVVLYGMFGVLFVATLGASAVSRVRGLNVVALFGVASLMGVQAAPMVFVAQYLAGMGRTMAAAPVLGAFMITGAAFAGATSYAFITRKDFSYLGAILSMGFWVVFAGAFVAIFISSEVFTLAIASVGAIVAVGMILVQTSRILRSSAMDDAVGDCLVLLVQLRNLFVWILRILMSSRR
jgi:modulator of FtsH protease